MLDHMKMYPNTKMDQALGPVNKKLNESIFSYPTADFYATDAKKIMKIQKAAKGY